MKLDITAAVDYCFRILLENADELLQAGTICYGSPDDAGSACLVIEDSGFFHEKTYGSSASLPEMPLPVFLGSPLLFGVPEIVRRDECIIVRADLIASTYFLVTRYEEWVRKDTRDRHGRFSAAESLPFRAGFLDRPVVEEYGRILRELLREAGIDVPEPDRKFKVLLTHDVDFIYKYRKPFRTAGGAFLGRKSWRDARESLAVQFGRIRDPYNTFDMIIDMDRVLLDSPDADAEAIYFFMSGGNSPHDGHYDINEPRARRVLHKVKHAGATVGLHASYDAGLHPELLDSEKAELEKAAGVKVTRNRHHFLGLRDTGDAHHLANAGFTWDSTMGYADRPGFRLGVCHPIPLFDPESFTYIGIEEHPLILMECTLSMDKYMGLDRIKAFETATRLIDTVREFRGEFVMLWHNTEFEERPGNYHPWLYREIIDYVRRKGEEIGLRASANRK